MLHIYQDFCLQLSECACMWVWVFFFKAWMCMSLTCPSSMSPLRMPGGLSSVLLVRRIDKLWALRFCLGWRAAKAEPLLLPPSTGIPPTSCGWPCPLLTSYLRIRQTNARQPRSRLVCYRHLRAGKKEVKFKSLQELLKEFGCSLDTK